MDIAFYLDTRYRDLWAHLVLSYRLDGAYEIGCPPQDATDKWRSVVSYEEIPGRRAFMCPQDSKGTKGTLPLSSINEYDFDVLVFGKDEEHNHFKKRFGDITVYFELPGVTPLHAVQAAAVVLWELNRGDYGQPDFSDYQ